VRDLEMQIDERIMEEKDGKIWVGESRVYLGEDNILNFIIVGDVDEYIAIAFEEAMLKLVGKIKGKVNPLIDLNGARRTSAKARKIFQERIMDDRTGRVALFGLNPVAKVIASFVLGITRKKDMRFFKTREEALAWLKE